MQIFVQYSPDTFQEAVEKRNWDFIFYQLFGCNQTWMLSLRRFRLRLPKLSAINPLARPDPAGAALFPDPAGAALFQKGDK
jgi:hypothetical protein